MAQWVKNPRPKAGDTGDAVSIPDCKDSLEEEMATHCSILARKKPMDRGIWQATKSWM